MSRTALHLVRGAGTRERAVALRLQGKTFEAIGQELGVSMQVAHRHVQRALAETAARTAEDAEALRTIELRRLEALNDAVWPEALTGDPRAVLCALRIAERRAKLLGLEAPVKVDVDGVTFIAAMQAAARRLDGPEPE